MHFADLTTGGPGVDPVVHTVRLPQLLDWLAAHQPDALEGARRFASGQGRHGKF